jgi:hypothetical protein
MVKEGEVIASLQGDREGIFRIVKPSMMDAYGSLKLLAQLGPPARYAA